MVYSWHDFLEFLHFICNLSLWLCTATLLYDVMLVLFGLPNNRRLARISHHKVNPKTRFAIVISARNEEKVIAYLIRSLLSLKYPKELYGVFVIADNCTDNTAIVAERAGATVMERFDESRATKGYALNWFFERNLEDLLKNYDHCVIFDADNLVDPHFLTYMDRHIQAGAVALAGYRDSKNPSENAIAGANSLFWLNQMRFLNQARSNLDLSMTSVSGTGFSFDLRLIQENGWQTETLTEDLEFTMQLILRGYQVQFVKEAVFYDEQVSEFKQMLRQRFRWGVGTAQTLRLCIKRLFVRGIKFDSSTLDAFWFLARIPFFLIITILSILRMVLRLSDQDLQLSSFYLDMAMPIMYFVGSILLMCLLVKLEGKKIKDYYKGILGYPLLSMIWGAQQLGALFFKDASWRPIKHNRAVEIESLRK